MPDVQSHWILYLCIYSIKYLNGNLIELDSIKKGGEPLCSRRVSRSRFL